MNVFWHEDVSGGIVGLNERWHNRAYKGTQREFVNADRITKIIQPFTSPLIQNPAANELWQIGDSSTIPQFVQTFNSGGTNNNVSIIKSNTPQNGYVYFDSDSLGTTYSSIAELETKGPIDLTGKSLVYFRLFFHLRRFHEILYIGISIDNGATYISLLDYMNTPFGGFMHVNTNTIPNNRMTFDISSLVANQSQVKFKILYEHFYDWGIMIDDLLLYEPLPLSGPFSDNLVKLCSINDKRLYFTQENNEIDGILYTHKLFINTDDFNGNVSYISDETETKVAIISNADFNINLDSRGNIISNIVINLEYYNNQNSIKYFGINSRLGYLYFKNDDINSIKLLFVEINRPYSYTTVALASNNYQGLLQFSEEINDINGIIYTHSLSISETDVVNYTSECYITNVPFDFGYALTSGNIGSLISNNLVNLKIAFDLANGYFFGIPRAGKLYFKNDSIYSMNLLFIGDPAPPTGPQSFSDGDVILYNYINNYEIVLQQEINEINSVIYTHKSVISSNDVNNIIDSCVFMNAAFDTFGLVAFNDFNNLPNGALISGSPINIELYIGQEIYGFGISRSGALYFKNDDINSMKALFIEDYVPPPGPEQFSYDNVILRNNENQFVLTLQSEENVINDITYTHKIIISETDILELNNAPSYFSNDDSSRVAIITENDFNNSLDANYGLISNALINLENYIDQAIYTFKVLKAGTLYFRNTDITSIVALFIETPVEPPPEPESQQQYVKKYNLLFGKYIIDSTGELDQTRYPMYITKTRYKLTNEA